MPRKKSADPEKILSRVLRIRLTDAAFKRLEKISKSSDCHTVGKPPERIKERSQGQKLGESQGQKNSQIGRKKQGLSV